LECGDLSPLFLILLIQEVDKAVTSHRAPNQMKDKITVYEKPT